MKKFLLWLLAALLFLITVKSPQGFVYPATVVIVLLRRRLAAALDLLPRWLAYLLAATGIGLTWEFFAILQNRDVAPDKRALLHPEPVVDLIFAVPYYLLLGLTWYLLLRKIAFSKKAVLFTTALFGLFVEQSGAVLFGAIASPIVGTLLAVLIVGVYATLAVLPYLLTEHRFADRTVPRFRHYVLAAVALVLFWAIYGNAVYNPLVHIFPK